MKRLRFSLLWLLGFVAFVAVAGDGDNDLYVANGPLNATPLRTTTISAGTTASPPPIFFNQVGHSLWAVLWAVAGGFGARYFHNSRTRPKQPGAAGVET